ncbi:hypothetical protein OS493_034229 [Desmophyllum pertusum]|uniref:Uncharacterized protein n=1 Tax=Desmophyllum pertusum TaxID=174260 RepID=A0A9W9Z9F8_9CNID|nr:hypothetical protein OS493_034229 [Desmophyllum pertusum]
MEVGLKAANLVEGSLKIRYDHGELELGKLDEEFFTDTDLNDILRDTELDPQKMERYKNEKLHLIYSVIYSEKFQLVKKGKLEVDGGVNVPGCAIIPLLKSKLKASLKMRTTFPKAVTRKTRGPVYLKCISVDYDEETGRMKLPDGVFGGKTLHRTVGDEELEGDDYGETTLAFDNEENDFTDEDFKKLEIIMKAVLMCEESRGRRQERVHKYLPWFKEALTGEKKLSIPDDEPLTPEDLDFLQSIYCPAPPDNQSTVDLSSFDTDKIQGYAILLQLINDLSDEHWDDIEKAWAEPEQDE